MAQTHAHARTQSKHGKACVHALCSVLVVGCDEKSFDPTVKSGGKKRDKYEIKRTQDAALLGSLTHDCLLCNVHIHTQSTRHTFLRAKRIHSANQLPLMQYAPCATQPVMWCGGVALYTCVTRSHPCQNSHTTALRRIYTHMHTCIRTRSAGTHSHSSWVEGKRSHTHTHTRSHCCTFLCSARTNNADHPHENALAALRTQNQL